VFGVPSEQEKNRYRMFGSCELTIVRAGLPSFPLLDLDDARVDISTCYFEIHVFSYMLRMEWSSSGSDWDLR
jgi:hypothetical protein